MSAASVSSTGRLKASDLPLAVPVVTIVSPARASSRASAWCDHSSSIPAASSAARRAGSRPSGTGVATPGRASSRVVATTWSSSAVCRSASQGYLSRTRPTGCDSTRAVLRSYHHSRFPPELLRQRKREAVSVVLPTREVADTIGAIVEQLQLLDGLVDQILVVDAASGDGTAEVAAGLGAEVHQESELLPQ